MADYVTWVIEHGCDTEQLDGEVEDWADVILRRLRTAEGLDLDTDRKSVV